VKNSVIRFLKARNVKPAYIHHQICQVYDEYAMSDGMVRKWVRKFNEGHVHMHDKPRRGLPAVFAGSHVLWGGDTENGAPL
jgi:transposase